MLNKIKTLPNLSDPNSNSSVFRLSVFDVKFVLQPLLLALNSASVKVIESVLECLFKLYSLGLIHGVIDGKGMIEAVCKLVGTRTRLTPPCLRFFSPLFDRRACTLGVSA